MLAPLSTAACVLVIWFGAIACSGRPPAPDDPIDGFPLTQQETVRRNLWRDWPLTVGAGTLGCDAGAVAFRAGGRTYAVNDAARTREFAPIDSIVTPEASPKPSNPLSRVTQEDRMKIFEEVSACAERGEPACTANIRARYRLTEAELEQITFEGRERVWPPLKRRPASTKALLDRGLALCAKEQER